jgi:cytochrome c oxidase cbb3-type subunit 3
MAAWEGLVKVIGLPRVTSTESRLSADGPRRMRAAERAVVVRLACVALAVVLAGCQSADEVAGPDPNLNAQLRGESAAFAGRAVSELVRDETALALAQQLFVANCAGCHGEDGVFRQGVMDLQHGVFNFGDSADAIHTTIADGRTSIMPAMGNKYGEMNLGQLVAYVESLSSSEPLSRLAEQGQQLYEESCIVCHGADGRGNSSLGAPNLTDEYWLHGDTMMAIRLLITRGAEGQCPAQGQVLTPSEIDLLTAYVLKLRDS